MEYIIIAVFSILITVIIIYLADKNLSPKKLLEKGRNALQKNKIETALKYFLRIINKLEPEIKVINNENKALLSLTYREAGFAYEKTGKIEYACNNYLKSKRLGSQLTSGAVSLISRQYVNKGIIDRELLDVFIMYLQINTKDDLSAQINKMIDKFCEIDENSDKEKLNDTMNICNKMILINKQNEWAYYKSGLILFIWNDFEPAAKRFNISYKLNSSRPDILYWLAASNGNQIIRMIKRKAAVESGEIEKVNEMLLKFIENSECEEEFSKYHSKAYILIGEIILFKNNIGAEKNLEETEINEYLNAISYFEKAIRKDTVSAFKCYTYMANIYSYLGQTIEAINSYKECISISPETSETYRLISNEYLKLKDYDSAKYNLQLCIKYDPKNIPALKLLFDIYVKIEDFQNAVRLFGLLEDLSAVTSGSSFNYIIAAYGISEYDLIIAETEKNTDFYFKQIVPDVVMYYIAMAYYKRDSFDKSLSWFDKLPYSPEHNYYKAHTLVKNDNYDEANKIFLSLMQTENEFNLKSSINAGNIFLLKNNYEEAYKCYLFAYNINPSDYDANLSLARYYFNIKNYDNSLRCFNICINIKKSAELYYAVSLIYEIQKKYIEAENGYEYCLNENYSGDIFLRLGIIKYRTKNYRAAKELLEKYLDLNSATKSALLYLALCNHQTEEYIKALEIWQKLLSNPDYDNQILIYAARTHYALGEKYLDESNFAEAINSFYKYLEYSGDEKVKPLLAELYYRKGISIPSVKVLERKECFQEAFNYNPNEKKYLKAELICELQLRNYGRAVEGYRLLSKSENVDDEIRFLLAFSLYLNDSGDEAVSLFSEIAANTKNGFSEKSKHIIANHHLKLNNRKEAIRMLEEIL